MDWRLKRSATQALPAPRTRRALREAAGLSQADIAGAVGVGKATVSRWESGTSSPTGEHLIRYTSLLRELCEHG